MRFKVGDKVRPIASKAEDVAHHYKRYWGTPPADGVYNVISLVEGTNGQELICIASPGGFDGPCRAASYFEPATVLKPCIVTLTDPAKGTFSPSVNPYIHPNRESALIEADRLAEKHPGKMFMVLEGVSITFAPPPIKPVATRLAF